MSVRVRWILAAISLLFVLLLTSCGGGSSTQSQTQITTPQAFYAAASDIPVSGPAVPGIDTYDQAVKAFMVKWNIPGLTIAVARNGQLIVARGYGYAEYDAKQLMQPDSRMRIASASKTFTAAAILHLVEQGKLRLDDRFLDVLSQYQVSPMAISGCAKLRFANSCSTRADGTGIKVAIPWGCRRRSFLP